MHGCSSGSARLVNAEVGSMGGVEGGVGSGTITAPWQTAIEKAQAELRQEYDVREERRRELEFLENGGNPLDFKLGNADSVSIQSTSHTNQYHEQFVTSEARGSFALTASPHGDSIESSGRPGAPLVCEPNSADNLMLFDGENEFLEGDRNCIHRSRSNIVPSEEFSQLGGHQHATDLEDSAVFGIPKKAYMRRYRTRPNRDGARSSSADVVPSRGGQSSSLPSRNGSRDPNGLISRADNHQDQIVSMNRDPKPTSPNGCMILKNVPSDTHLITELDGMQVVESAGLTKGHLPDAVSHAEAPKNLRDNQRSQQFVNLETPFGMASEGPKIVGGRVQVVSGLECVSLVATTKGDNQAGSGQMNGFDQEKGDRKNVPTDGQNNSAALSTKGCTQTIVMIDRNIDSEMCTNFRKSYSNGNIKEQILASEGTPHMEGDELVKEKNENKADDSCAFINDSNSSHQIHQGNVSKVNTREELNGSGPTFPNDVNDPNVVDGMEPNDITGSETETKPCNLLGESLMPHSENACTDTLQGSVNFSNHELPDTKSSVRISTVAEDHKTCPGVQPKLVNEVDEDSILEEARIIEVKRKRIAELSIGTQTVDNCRKSHWDYVIEEMGWLANDFAQERRWKISAAARLSYQVAFASRLRFKEQNSCWKQKYVAHTLAKAVMEFWHSVEEMSKGPEPRCRQKDFAHSVHGYAIRFLKHSSSHATQGQAEAPRTPDSMPDLGILDMSWADLLTEENLFYTVPAGAMETYRKSIESYLMQCEKTGCSTQEEVETSYDAVPDFKSQDNAYEEDEGETNTYYLPGAFEGSRSLKFAPKNPKNLMKKHGARPYEMGADLPFLQCMDKKVGSEHSVLMRKRPANSVNVSVPTKRVRTASRQRVVSPFGPGASGSDQAPVKTDASSGDTNSFHDDHGTMHGGSHIQNSVEVESMGDFQKQLPFDSSEVSTRPKKKKKPKYLGSTYDQRWLIDSNFQNEQRDYLKKRSHSPQLESNGSSGVFGQHIMKKPKMMKQSLDCSFDNRTPMVGSTPSPVASQMSNMSNPNKFIKMLGGRDRGRKAKGPKIPAGQPGSGSLWSLFEDQALVVLVHDMGPNWELVSDAMNSTLQFKCIFRKPKECKERHKTLMDRTTGDGVDSAEDSGSSQPYPSTLPGIPKGSARQLFQRLQGPMEEDTLKSHFEKIILIGQKHHYWKNQSGNQDPKQLQQPHGSHTVALSHVCPNNLNGGSILTPRDLCDATVSSPDVLSVGYQGPHTSGLGIPNQSTVAQMLPASGANSSVQGSSNVILGNNHSSPSGPGNASVRDGRYGVPRTASLSIDEHQRMQQYNQMLSSKNIQQSSSPVPGALPGTDRGVRMLPGANGMGIMCGVNRSIPMTRPAFQGIASSSMLNSGIMISSGMVAMPNPGNMEAGAGGQVNSMLRPREALHLMRPSQSPEPQKQMMVPNLQMQVSQGIGQGVPPFGGLSSSFSNPTVPPPVQSYPLHHQQPRPMSSQQNHVLGNSHHPHLQAPPNHPPNMQHQAYAIRLAKERHQRMLQQQQAASNALMSHVPVSSPPQISSQIQSQTSSPVSLSPPTSSMTPMSQHQQKHQMPPYGAGPNAQPSGSGLITQMGKQRQRQPQLQQQQQFQQAGRHHPPQRQQSQAQQQTKPLKEVGRGNIMMHQNLTMDPSMLNGLSTTPGSQSTEIGEQVMHFMHGQGLYSVQPSKQSVPPHSSNQSHPQQKISKQLQQIPSNAGNSNQGHVPPVASGPTSSAPHQAVPSLNTGSSKHERLHPHHQHHPKLVNQTQPNVQRVLQQSRQVNADPAIKLRARDVQADQNPVNNSSQKGMVTKMPQTCVAATNVIPVVSSSGASQLKVSEPLYDSGKPNSATQLGSTGTPPSLTNSAGSEPTTLVSHELGQRPSSGSLSSLGNDIDTQWQPQPSQQQLPPQHPQPQPQLLQAGNNSLYVRPTNSRLE